ncbi:MAG: DUF1156 domain-containing protein [Pirellulales bacterium]
MSTSYPKRLIEVDLPIARISAHARREKSIRHGHISTLHIWWARRPLAACRAVICASLWPDPADPLCPQSFRDAAAEQLTVFAKRVVTEKIGAESDQLQKTASPESLARCESFVKSGIELDPKDADHQNILRFALLDFIADFANWDNSTVPAYLETSRALTQAAHEALGGAPGTRPLVVDPFAGGGSIPLEALRVGADAFASDLNPIPVLLNKVVLEYIPEYGQKLADEVRKWGQWIKEEAEKELAEFYPKDPDGSTPIAYLWARTILSEAPGQGDVPVEVPLMRSLWLAKKTSRRRALRWVRNDKGQVQTETVEVAYVEDAQPVVKCVRRPLLEIFEPARESDVEGGTVARGSATCPVTGYTTKVDSVRAQLKLRRGGAADARLFAVVTTRDHEQGRFYRLPTLADQKAFTAAATELERREKQDGTSRARKGRRESEGIEASQGSRRSLVPDEPLDMRGIRHTWAMIYGLERWGDLFSPRQALALTTLARLVREVGKQLSSTDNGGLAQAVQVILAMQVGKQADLSNTLCRWEPVAQCPRQLFARQAVGMCWDFSEGVPIGEASGGFGIHIERSSQLLSSIGDDPWSPGHIEQASATHHPLPDDSAAAFVTDPPYYDAVPYAYLSDFFYVWMRRTLADVHPALFREGGVPKDAEIVVDRPHQLSQSNKDIAFYERELTKAFAEGRRITQTDGVGAIVFASKTTASWEAILKAVVDAGWVITGSWPIDTEMETRVSAQGQSRLASSVHLVTRPRQNPDGTLREEIGEWRDVLSELPKRIHEWMPRLASEGVVGADAIFACLGPALEIFSRYSRVEKASGEAVPLREYLEHVWGAVSTEALSLIFHDADAAGLEPDARMTAMWLWTLGAGTGKTAGNGKPKPVIAGFGSDNEADDAPAGKTVESTGYTLEFDAARKIAQGLGINLEKSEWIVEVKGDKARLLSVSERTRYLFGKDGESAVSSRGRKKKKPQQQSLFQEVDALDADDSAGLGLKASPGETVLDRVHQSMILFAAGRGEALRRFLVDDGAGNDGRFWKLAQSLSALYPKETDEKRWVDGVLARKKGLGL